MDYPVSNFYQDIMAAFPEAKVLLSLRDPVKWYHSVKVIIIIIIIIITMCFIFRYLASISHHFLTV